MGLPALCIPKETRMEPLFLLNTRSVQYKLCRKHTGVNLGYGMDFDDTVRPVWRVDSVVCNALHSNT